MRTIGVGVGTLGLLVASHSLPHSAPATADTTIPECVYVTINVTQPPITGYVCP